LDGFFQHFPVNGDGASGSNINIEQLYYKQFETTRGVAPATSKFPCRLEDGSPLGDFMEGYNLHPDLIQAVDRILLPQEKIQARIEQLGREISADYSGKSPILVGLLRGGICFFSDLLQAISLPVEIDFLSVSSYSPEMQEIGYVRLMKDLELSISDRHVIFVKDIIDTGLTLNYLLRTLKTRKPASLEVCVLLNKEKRRLIDLPLRYVGFEIPDYYVVGYGLDYQEKYRNLPFIGMLKAEMMRNNH